MDKCKAIAEAWEAAERAAESAALAEEAARAAEEGAGNANWTAKYSASRGLKDAAIYAACALRADAAAAAAWEASREADIFAARMYNRAYDLQVAALLIEAAAAISR